jgi:hypothetical protein
MTIISVFWHILLSLYMRLEAHSAMRDDAMNVPGDRIVALQGKNVGTQGPSVGRSGMQQVVWDCLAVGHAWQCTTPGLVKLPTLLRGKCCTHLPCKSMPDREKLFLDAACRMTTPRRCCAHSFWSRFTDSQDSTCLCCLPVDTPPRISGFSLLAAALDLQRVSSASRLCWACPP